MGGCRWSKSLSGKASDVQIRAFHLAPNSGLKILIDSLVRQSRSPDTRRKTGFDYQDDMLPVVRLRV